VSLVFPPQVHAGSRSTKKRDSPGDPGTGAAGLEPPRASGPHEAPTAPDQHPGPDQVFAVLDLVPTKPLGTLVEGG